MIVALESLVTVVVETLKVPDVTPAATVIDAGTVSTPFVLVSVTNAPPAGATFVNVTVHVLDPFGPKLVGLHESEETSTAADRFTVVFAELLLYVAVIVALESLLTVVVVTLNVPLVTPAATVIEAGTVSTAFVFVNVTNAPPAGATFVNLTVHVLDPFGPKLLGLHESEETSTAADRFTVVFAELLLYVAVIVALESLETVVVETLNVPDVTPAATVIDAGTVSTPFVLVNVTSAPPAGATFVNVTVHVLDPFGPKLLGLHDTEETSTAADRFTVVFAELLLYVAVIVALESLETVVVETLNVPDVTPAATVIDAGTVSTPFVLVNVTSAPPAGATFVNVTVHVLDPFGPKLVGLHESEETFTGATRFTVVFAELLL